MTYADLIRRLEALSPEELQQEVTHAWGSEDYSGQSQEVHEVYRVTAQDVAYDGCFEDGQVLLLTQ